MVRDLDALIVVSSPWVDGASAAGQTLEWLANHGMAELIHRTVVVLNDSDGHADRRTRTILAQHFADHGRVVIEVPFDPHLRPGGVIGVTNEMSPKTRRRFYEIAAAIAEQLNAEIANIIGTQRLGELRSMLADICHHLGLGPALNTGDR